MAVQTESPAPRRHRVNSRLLRCVVASIPYLAVMALMLYLVTPDGDRARMMLTFLPLAGAISIGMDYFVYRTPEREARREAKRDARREARRPNIRL